MEERRSEEFLEPMDDESLPLLNGNHARAVTQNSELGENLKRARMLAGYSLEDVSKVLRIRLAYLESLEAGEFDELPGSTYAVGFLRSYSAYLGLDSEEMVARLKQGSDGTIAKPDLSFHMPNREISRPRPILIFIVLALAGVAYGGWHLYSTQGQIANELVTDVSTTLTEVAGFSNDDEVMVEVASEADNSLETNSEKNIKSSGITNVPLGSDERVVNAEYEEEIQNVNDTGRDAESIINSDLNINDMDSNAHQDSGSSQVVAEPSEVSEVNTNGMNSNFQEAPASDNNSSLDTSMTEGAVKDTEVIEHEVPKTYGVENINARVIITATEDSWVQIQGPNKELVLTEILRNGDIFRVPDRSDLKMVTGNAGALEIRVDGALIESIGPIGVVRRDISLDPEQLLATNGVEN